MNEKYKLIVEEAKEAIIIINEGVIEYANAYAVKKLNCEKEDLLGAYFLDFVSEEDKEMVSKNYQRTLKGRETFLYEVNLRKKEGELFPVEIQSQKLEYNGKNVDLAFIRDISAKKKAEEVFRQQEKRLHTITENTPDVIARYDRDFRYVYINTAGAREQGINKSDFFWKTDKDLGIDSEKSEAFREAIELVFEKKEKKTFYSEEMINEERRYYYTILIPEFFKDGEVNSVLSITRDITEIKEIDQIKSEFISITSHQLRSPLSIINWCSLSLLRGDEGDLKGEQKEYLERIYSSSKNLIRITDVFLNTTMMDLEIFVFNFQKIDIVEESKKVIKEFKQIAKEKEINFTEEYEEIFPGKIDPRALKIVLRGLISNAIDYTGKGGNVSFSLSRGGERKIVFEIGDDGCGISEEEKRKIFTKFYRAEQARNMKTYGTGLDLYLINSVLEKIGGSINVKSPNPNFGKGSLFSVEFPIFIEGDV